ncbi:hypothetical protein RND71_038418 [Anisodus tanguticus]|uniref:Uncharacterized protein n=1 Tax=Anisodus tanguticus TaxID=243964 RepID=A0AAE1R2L7_9SOLA|nr:hypothetical protein RND71_038418 [Anisodus tanguticus]
MIKLPLFQESKLFKGLSSTEEDILSSQQLMLFALLLISIVISDLVCTQKREKRKNIIGEALY